MSNIDVCENFGVKCQCLSCRPIDVCTEDPCSVCDGPVSHCDPGEALEDTEESK